MKQKIIQAIQNFDILLLDVFLSDDKSYMDVSKSLFMKALENKFNEAREQGCTAFDEVIFGICGSCNKGCEAISFLSESGFYLDLFIESENNIDVNDIYVCYKIIDSKGQYKKYNLGPHFYEDEKVTFYANPEYKLVEQKYRLMHSEIASFKEDVKREDFMSWYDQYEDLRNLDFIETTLLKLYTKIGDEIKVIDKMLEKEFPSVNFLQTLKEALSVSQKKHHNS